MNGAGRASFVVPGSLDTPTGGYGYDREIVAGLERAAAGPWRCTTLARRLSASGPRRSRRRRSALLASLAGRAARRRRRPRVRRPARRGRARRRRGSAWSRSCTIRWPTKPALPRPTAAGCRGERAPGAGGRAARRGDEPGDGGATGRLRRARRPDHGHRCRGPSRRRRRAARAIEPRGEASCCASPRSCRAKGTTCSSRRCTSARAAVASHLRGQPGPRPAGTGGAGPAPARVGPRDADRLRRDRSGAPTSTGATTPPTSSCCRRCYEGYGMAVAEALARGLPVVSTAPAPLPDLVDERNGVLVPPGDPAALTLALSAVIGDALARAAGRGRPAGARRLPSWDDAAAAMASVPSRPGRMGDFSAEWLALREPADAAARSERLLQAVAGAVHARDQPPGLDLGARHRRQRALSRRAAAPQQQWPLVDHDPRCSIEAPRDCGCSARPWLGDEGLADHGAARPICRRFDPASVAVSRSTLVTASALLDLVSAAWIEALASECRVAGAAGLFALTYDGRIHCRPRSRATTTSAARERAPARRQGLRPGARARRCTSAAECFGALGYAVDREAQRLAPEPDRRGLQRQLIEGWARAAVQMAPDRARVIREPGPTAASRTCSRATRGLWWDTRISWRGSEPRHSR